MFKTIRNAFKVKELRGKILYTFMMLVVIRFGCQLPIPGIETSFFANWFAKQTTDVFGFFNAMTGGSFSSMSIFALSITPYITSSIIIQLLTIAIPKLEEMQKDGEEGRKKIQEYTRYTTVGLALLESSAMAIGFGRQGLLLDYNAWNVIIAIVTMTTGSALLMWIGEQITDKGVGNGISIVLLFNILSSIPDDIKSLYYRFIFGQSFASMAEAVVLISVGQFLRNKRYNCFFPLGQTNRIFFFIFDEKLIIGSQALIVKNPEYIHLSIFIKIFQRWNMAQLIF